MCVKFHVEDGLSMGKKKCTQEGIHPHWHSASRVHQNHLTEAHFHSYCSFLWASLVLWKALSGSHHHRRGWSFQSVLGRHARSGFLSLHSAPPIKHTGEKESHHSILQTQGGTTMCWDAPLPLLYLTPLLQTISRLDLPITDCLRGFLGKTGDGMNMGPGISVILSVTVRLCTRPDHWLAAFTGMVLGTGIGTVALKRNRGCLKV